MLQIFIWKKWKKLQILLFEISHSNPASYLKYFWTYWIRKTWLLKCIKGPVSEIPSAVNMLPLVLPSPKTGKISRDAFLSYFFMNLGQIDLEKVIFTKIWGFRTAC